MAFGPWSEWGLVFFTLSQLETIDAKGAGAMPHDNLVKPERSPAPDTQLMFNVLGLVHAVFWLLGEGWQIWSQFAFAFIPARLGGGETIPFPQGAQVWSFVTYGLLHADIYHLGANSIWLLIFSTPLARRLGALRYLVLIMLSAAAGAAAMLVQHWGQFLVIVGASGAVSATLAAVIPIMFAPGFDMGSSHLVDYEKLRVLRPQELLQNPRALGFTAVFLAMTLFTAASMATTGTAFLEERSIAWEAHLGGFVAGFILFYLLDKKWVP
jgi:membrane associated rhomboid family serine protease